MRVPGAVGWILGRKPFCGLGVCLPGGFWFRIGFWSGFFGLEALQFLERVAVVAVGAIDAALEACELVCLSSHGYCQPDVAVGRPKVLTAQLPELGLANAEAAEEPLAIDEGVDDGQRCSGVVGWKRW